MADRLLRLRRALNTYLVKARVRVLYDRLRKRPEVRRFRDDLSLSILSQAKAIATIENLGAIVEEFEKLSSRDETKITAALRRKYLPASDFVDSNGAFEFLLWSGEQGGAQAAKLIGAGGVFRLKNSALRVQLEKRRGWLIDSLDESNFESLRVAVTEGIERDLSVRDLRQYITKKVDDMSAYRSEMVTRTEFANASTMVAKKTYQKNGVEQWEWVWDGGECDVCEPNDGEIRDIGDNFPSGDDRPPAHPNCKCDVIPRLPDGFDAEGAWLGED